MDVIAPAGKILGLGHTAGKLHGHKTLVLARELAPDGVRALRFFCDPHLRGRAGASAGIHAPGLGRRLICLQVILQCSPIGGLCRRAEEPHRRIHRPGFDGLFLHTTGGITREGQNVLAAHGRERSGRNFRRFHCTDGAEIACPPRTEQQGRGTAFPIADQCRVGFIHREGTLQLGSLFAHQLIQAVQCRGVIAAFRTQRQVPDAAVLRLEEGNADPVFLRDCTPQAAGERVGKRFGGGVIRRQDDGGRCPRIHPVRQIIDRRSCGLAIQRDRNIPEQADVHIEVGVFRIVGKGLSLAHAHGRCLAIHGGLQRSVGLLRVSGQCRGCHGCHCSAQCRCSRKLHKITAFHSIFSLDRVRFFLPHDSSSISKQVRTSLFLYKGYYIHAVL